ncbi:MAG: ROK family protein [Acetobacter sp.]|nr:ROK family protein [Bacteroides sp.]MCM1342106.1 ROK family protein [Acetobacter sp.]MCM1434316.1 ROK family protein [Clostridiales bacterium]
MKILTFDIGGTDIKYALCDENFVISKKQKVPTDAQKGGKALIEKVISIIEEFEDIDRIGISTAGQVDSTSGTVVYSTGNIPEYTGTKVKKIIEERTGIPAFVENDVNSFALGEARFGAGKDKSDFICLTYGTGIGGAIYLNNQLYKGSGSSAGEFGHMIIHSNGKDCTCGGCGCYECYASAKALVQKVNENNSLKLDGIEIFKEENFSKPAIRNAVDEWIDEVITGLINIVYIFNPSLIILGGGIMNEPYIINAIDRKIYNQLMENFRSVKIVQSGLGSNSALLGVASEAINLKDISIK